MTETSQATGPEAAAGPKDFSRPRTPKIFTIDEDTFEAASALPGETFVEFTTRFEEFQESDSWKENYRLLLAALELVLLPDSYTLLCERLADKKRPVELDQVTDIVDWLMGEYGMRPTQPSPDSSDGSDDQESGTSSTGSTPPEESTSEPSPPTDS